MGKYRTGSDAGGALNALSDQIGSITTFDYTYAGAQIAANSALVFNAANAVPSGYSAIAIVNVGTGDEVLTLCVAQATNGLIRVRNMSSSPKTATPNMKVLIMKS